MKKPRTKRDEEIRCNIADVLNEALKKRGVSPEKAAGLLQVGLGTMYKYLAGSMIPGGHVLWRACHELGLVLDENGLRLSRARNRKSPASLNTEKQYDLPFINESVAGDRVHLMIHRKDSRWVRVALRIKVAG